MSERGSPMEEHSINHYCDCVMLKCWKIVLLAW